MKGAAAALLLLAPACGNKQPTVIDGSSPEAFERTVAQARREIPDADRLVYDRAIKTIGGRRFAYLDAEAAARTTFDGMTAEQIVEDQRMRDQ